MKITHRPWGYCTDCETDVKILEGGRGSCGHGRIIGHHAIPTRADLCADPALLAEAGKVLRKLRHAVCGETGFAACVRLDSGKAYPWPALDEADEAARAFLSKLENRHG